MKNAFPAVPYSGPPLSDFPHTAEVLAGIDNADIFPDEYFRQLEDPHCASGLKEAITNILCDRTIQIAAPRRKFAPDVTAPRPIPAETLRSNFGINTSIQREAHSKPRPPSFLNKH